jgi:N,N'-diacetyllegionaminate synthase
MIIDGRDLEERVFVVAEIGNNHEGDLALAEEMIHLAADAGADAVKFQSIVPDKLVSVQHSDRIAQLESFQFSMDQFAQLAEVANECCVSFLSTPFDLQTVADLTPLVPAFKISSGDNNFFPLLEKVAKTGKPMLVSTGMMQNSEISGLCKFIEEVWEREGKTSELALLHCVSNYPTPLNRANLSAIEELKQFGHTLGYSDHTMGIEAVKLAVALGARLIEKHFTISNTHSDFRDHQLSSNPHELKLMINEIRRVESMMGEGRSEISENEKDVLLNMRRSIVAASDLSRGHEITIEDLNWVRPGEGMAPGQEAQLIGRKLKRNIFAGENFVVSDCE